jgi:hypothetical protein
MIAPRFDPQDAAFVQNPYAAYGALFAACGISRAMPMLTPFCAIAASDAPRLIRSLSIPR